MIFLKQLQPFTGVLEPCLRWDFWGLLTDGATKPPTSLKSITHSYNDETWYSFTLLKEDPKNIEIT